MTASDHTTITIAESPWKVIVNDDEVTVVVSDETVSVVAVGSQGPAGAGILSGTGAPGPSVGSDGDFYIATDLHRIYGPKTSGAWDTGTDIVGPAGTSAGDLKRAFLLMGA